MHCGTLARQHLTHATFAVLSFAGCVTQHAANAESANPGAQVSERTPLDAETASTAPDSGDAAPSGSEADQGTDPQILATHQSTPVGLAVSAGAVFWVNAGRNLSAGKFPAPWTEGTINKCEASGCPNGPTVLAANLTFPVGTRFPLPIVVYDKHVYWVDASGLAICGTTGCDEVPTIIEKAAGGSTMAVVGSRLFLVRAFRWADLSSCTLPACADLDLLWNEPSAIGPLAADAKQIVWIGSRVMTCETPTCASHSTLTSINFVVRAIAMDSTNIYFIGDSAKLARCSRDSCDSTLTALAEDLEAPISPLQVMGGMSIGQNKVDSSRKERGNPTRDASENAASMAVTISPRLLLTG